MPSLLDADVIISALVGRPRTINAIRKLSPEGLAVSLVTVGEVYEGAFRHANPQAHLDIFRDYLSPYTMLGLSDRIMERFAALRADLRRQGLRISDFDIILAATALDRDLTILSYNVRHLVCVDGLRVHRPS